MDNKTFLETLNVSTENQQKCLDAMERYGENKWWEADVDPRKFAYYQVQEDILLGSFNHFHESVELLLGRPVYSHEFGISRNTLVQEAERAWKYQIGVTSEKERQERVQESIDTLHIWANQHGKQVIDIDLSGQNS